MPKLFEYFGIIIFFYSNEHEPIHVHGKYGGRETKAEIHFYNGNVKKISLKDKGKGLESAKRAEFEKFVSAYAGEIVDRWVDYFIKKKPIKSKIITKKVK